MRNLIFSSKNSNFIIQNRYSFINTRQLHVFFNKPELETNCFWLYLCGFTCFEPKIVFVMILRTLFGSQQVNHRNQQTIGFIFWLNWSKHGSVLHLFSWDFEAYHSTDLVKKSFKVKSNFGLPILNHHNCYHSNGNYTILFRAVTVIWLCSLPLVSNLWKLFEMFDHIANFWKIDWHEKLVKWHQTKLWYK